MLQLMQLVLLMCNRDFILFTNVNLPTSSCNASLQMEQCAIHATSKHTTKSSLHTTNTDMRHQLPTTSSQTLTDTTTTSSSSTTTTTPLQQQSVSRMIPKAHSFTPDSKHGERSINIVISKKSLPIPIAVMGYCSNRLDGHQCGKIIWWNGQHGRRRSLIPLWLFSRWVDVLMILIFRFRSLCDCIIRGARGSGIEQRRLPRPAFVFLSRSIPYFVFFPCKKKHRILKIYRPRRSTRVSPLSPIFAPLITYQSTSFSWMPYPAGWGIGCRDCDSLRFTMPAEWKEGVWSSRKCFCRSQVFNSVCCVCVCSVVFCCCIV